MAPAVMQASAPSAKARPAAAKRVTTRLCHTTMASPVSASSRPPRRAAPKRRSTSASVRMGCTPSSVAISPGVMPWAMAWK